MTTTTQAMPDWLLTKLDREGVLDAATRLTRNLRPRRCRTCGLFTLAALDDYTRPTHVDPLPITNAGELFALLTGRPTWWHLTGEGLIRRDPWHITHHPANTTRVHVNHDCHGPPIPANPRFMPKPRPTTTDEPPY